MVVQRWEAGCFHSAPGLPGDWNKPLNVSAPHMRNVLPDQKKDVHQKRRTIVAHK